MYTIHITIDIATDDDDLATVIHGAACMLSVYDLVPMMMVDMVRQVGPDGPAHHVVIDLSVTPKPVEVK